MTNQRSFFTRPRLWSLLGGLTLAVAQFLTPVGAGTAHAAPTCTNSGQQVTCTFNFMGAPETWTVPAGVTQATFQLVGAPGGRSGGVSFAHVDGGRGADLKATLPLVPGADVAITVGGPGGTDGRETGGFNGGGGGRFLGNSYSLAGGGGGATDIRIGGTALTDRVLVAGGGGGGGSYGQGSGPGGSGGSAGGVGGNADMSGLSAPPNGSANGGGGGANGTAGGQGGAAGGSGVNPGGDGSLGQGGTVAEHKFINGAGGGGGGGYVGGGGGGAGGETFVPSLGAGGGGGGGGSSFASASATNVTLTTDTTNVPKVVITYVDTIAPSVTINQAAGQVDPTSNNPVLFSANFSEPVTGFIAQDVTLSGTADLSSASVTVNGGPQSYTISVAGVAGNGMVIATIAANGAVDKGGNGNTASTSTDNSVTVNLDSTPPVITSNVVGTLGNNDWYTSDVNISWSVVDNESAIASQSGCEAQSVTSDTSGVTFTCTATSSGGSNSASMTIQRDTTPPVVSVTGVNNGASYTVGSVPTAACSTSDTLSDVATQASLSITGGNADGTGSFTATCSGATDNAGNSGSASVSYTVNAVVLTIYQQVQAVRSNLAALPPSSDSKTAKTLQKAIGKIDQALAANLWQPDGNHLSLIGHDVFNRLQDAVKELAKIKHPSPAIGTASSTLATFSRALAQIALDEALAGQGEAKKIAKAQSKLSKGDSEATKGKWDKAIAQYEDCWEYAQQALGLPVASSLLAEEQPDSDETGEDEATSPTTLTHVLFLPQINR